MLLSLQVVLCGEAGDVSVTVEAVDGGSEVTCAPLLYRLFSVVRPGTCLSRWRPWTEGLR